VDALSDDELMALIMKINPNQDIVGAMPELDVMGPAPVYRIRAYGLVVKIVHNGWYRNEVYMMEFVRKHTTIPDPQVHRVLPFGSSHCIVMDYVEGECLLAVWSKLSWWRRIQVVFSLRHYIQQLCRTPLPFPDIPDPFDGNPLHCNGGHFSQDSGPLSTYIAMADWHDCQNHRSQVSFHIPNPTGIWRYLKFDTSMPLVLCHFDLHLRNIMLDKDNRVWLIDWAFAGAYPPWFEHSTMASWANADHPRFRFPGSFSRFIGFIVGGYEWYYYNYIEDFILRLEHAQRCFVEEDHFVKLSIEPKLWQPVVARPSLRERTVHRCLGRIYDVFLRIRNTFVAEYQLNSLIVLSALCAFQILQVSNFFWKHE
ncbi:kinase-like protein, partial [Mycena floridula]